MKHRMAGNQPREGRPGESHESRIVVVALRPSSATMLLGSLRTWVCLARSAAATLVNFRMPDSSLLPPLAHPVPISGSFLSAAWLPVTSIFKSRQGLTHQPRSPLPAASWREPDLCNLGGLSPSPGAARGQESLEAWGRSHRPCHPSSSPNPPLHTHNAQMRTASHRPFLLPP